jgi:hypothetical protein
MSWQKILDALADGIEVRIKIQSRLSDKTIEQTMSIARYLEIPEEEIVSWAQLRASRAKSNDKAIRYLLGKLCKNGAAHDTIFNFVRYKIKGDDNFIKPSFFAKESGFTEKIGQK